jgi:putative chitinase
LIDRDKFFDAVRAEPFGGNLTQLQVDGLNFLLDVWERHFKDSDIRWLAYSLATAFHETSATMEPIPEYGEGSGQPYGEPAGPYGQCYFGRGYVQLTWEYNYIEGEKVLAHDYGVECPMHSYPHRMLEHEPAALVLYDGSIKGWFTGKKLGDYFNATAEDAYNARRVINGVDKADLIAGYYRAFKAGLA